MDERPPQLRVPSEASNVVSLADARAKKRAAALSFEHELEDCNDVQADVGVCGIQNRAGEHRVGVYGPDGDGWALTPDQAEELASWLQRYAEQARQDAQKG